MITGANIIGGNGERVENDYYATPPEAVRKLLQVHNFKLENVLEPCVGAGHIAGVLSEMVSRRIDCIDIVNRGFPGTIQTDFLKWEGQCEYDTIITNPPYLLASEFIEKCMDLLVDGGQLAMFLKIQFLEGAKRKELFSKYPPEYVYVFRNRISAWNNGSAVDPKTGKSWSSTITFCWYVWKKGSCSEPIVRWID